MKEFYIGIVEVDGRFKLVSYNRSESTTLRKILFSISGTVENFIQFQTGLLLILWGLWLCFPGLTFNFTGPLRILLILLPEILYGLFMMAIGIGMLLAVYYNNIRVQKNLCFIAMLIWSIIDILFIFSIANATATAIPVYFVHALTSGIGYWMIREKI